MSELFQIRHADPSCREKICLPDYEAAFARHQELQFRKYREHAAYATPEQAEIAGNFERFRAALWGESSYASRIFLRVHLPGRAGTQALRLEDIAVDGEVLYEDMKALLEQGRVEILVPGYFCGASGAGMSAGLEIYLDKAGSFSRGDFRALIRELDELRPLHGEGMGNAFWFRCVESVFPTPSEPQGSFLRHPLVLSLAQNLLMELGRVAVATEEFSCPEDDIAYFDEDKGLPVCESDEGYSGEAESETGIGGAWTLLSGEMSRGLAGGAAAGGMMVFSKFGAERIGAAVLKASLGSSEASE